MRSSGPCSTGYYPKNEMKQKHIERIDVVVRRLLEMAAVGVYLAIELSGDDTGAGLSPLLRPRELRRCPSA